MLVKVLSASLTWPVSAEMSFFTAVTSFSRRSTVALSSMLFFLNLRVDRFQLKRRLAQEVPHLRPHHPSGSCGVSTGIRCSLRIRATISSGEDRKAPIGPHNQVQKAS